MAAQKTTPPPIDRPLSKSYIREFLGWSTAFSPSLADSASMRQMENVLIGRDGSARVRPAMRAMLYAPHGYMMVGGFEQYYGVQGKAILFAMRDLNDDTVSFYTSVYNGYGYGNSIQSATDSPKWAASTTYVKYLQINNRIYCLNNGGTDPVAIFDTNTGEFLTIIDQNNVRPATPALARSSGLDDEPGVPADYNYAFFTTVTNSFGESMPSQLAHITATKKWTGWEAGDKITLSGMHATNLKNIYFVFWSADAPVPVEGVLVAEGHVGATWEATTNSLLASSSAGNHFLPSPADLDFTIPPVCAQGLVAADRLILVNDFENRARIRWSGNDAAAYGNFSPGRGGGYKTLSSGNLQIPYAIQLWQNPQSVDTLTILCAGLDGYHTAYYMSPASVTSQMEETMIMGFEETTATPGTVSPYGNEVHNNALYHPLDDQLMKSTANNYNINHKTMSEAIAPTWLNLINKHNIISSQYDGKLYYIVHNPDGAELQEGCLGNEIWVCDVGTGEAVPWSRFLIQATSLRKIEYNNRLYMGVVTDDGIFRLDELAWLDEWSSGEEAIPWFFQTNTQGANGARDSWVTLQQVNPVFGNAYGTFRYGIQGWTVNGKTLDLSKVYRQHVDIEPGRELPFDAEDKLLVRQIMQQWFFSAGSVIDHETGKVRPSFGQISNVQYTFTPASVNIGYELGSTETYEYAHADNVWTDRTSINGIPIPMLDPRRP